MTFSQKQSVPKSCPAFVGAATRRRKLHSPSFCDRAKSPDGGGIFLFLENPTSRFAGSGWLFSWMAVFGTDARSIQTRQSAIELFGAGSFCKTRCGTGWLIALCEKTGGGCLEYGNMTSHIDRWSASVESLKALTQACVGPANRSITGIGIMTFRHNLKILRQVPLPILPTTTCQADLVAGNPVKLLPHEAELILPKTLLPLSCL